VKILFYGPLGNGYYGTHSKWRLGLPMARLGGSMKLVARDPVGIACWDPN